MVSVNTSVQWIRSGPFGLINGAQEFELFMNEPQPSSDLVNEEQVQLADLELSSSIAAVVALYGREEAELSAQDWRDESDLIEGTPPDYRGETPAT